MPRGCSQTDRNSVSSPNRELMWESTESMKNVWGKEEVIIRYENLIRPYQFGGVQKLFRFKTLDLRLKNIGTNIFF